MNDCDRCSICGARVQAMTTTYTQEMEGRITVVTDVPIVACPQCGERYFTTETVDRLQELIQDGPMTGEPPRTIEVPVYRFSRV